MAAAGTGPSPSATLLSMLGVCQRGGEFTVPPLSQLRETLDTAGDQEDTGHTGHRRHAMLADALATSGSEGTLETLQ